MKRKVRLFCQKMVSLYSGGRARRLFSQVKTHYLRETCGLGGYQTGTSVPYYRQMYPLRSTFHSELTSPISTRPLRDAP